MRRVVRRDTSDDFLTPNLDVRRGFCPKENLWRICTIKVFSVNGDLFFYSVRTILSLNLEERPRVVDLLRGTTRWKIFAYAREGGDGL